MRKCKAGVAVLSLMVLFAPGCASEPGLDKGKFAELHRTALELKAVATSTAPCDVPDALLQKLAAGTAALKDRTASKSERDLLDAYAYLLTIYRDGVLLCQSRTLLADFPFVPRGEIYVAQELDPVVEKYDLATEKHLYKPTGQYWKSVPADSIKVIWQSAERQTKYIENVVNYN